MLLCVTKVQSCAHLRFVHFACECYVQNCACSLFQSTDEPINRSDFEFSSNFQHFVRKSIVLKSHVVKSSVTSPPRRQPSASKCSERESRTHPPIPLRCQLNSHCCFCWNCLLCQALLFLVPLCFSLSFDWCVCHIDLLFHNTLREAVKHLQAAPNRQPNRKPNRNYHLLDNHFGRPTPTLLMLVALKVALLRPESDVSCAEIPPHSVPRQIGQSVSWPSPVSRVLQ